MERWGQAPGEATPLTSFQQEAAWQAHAPGVADRTGA